MSLKKEGKALRACKGCLFLQKGSEFMAKGCPNCEDVLQMQQSRDAVEDYTTTQFEGGAAIISPRESWVARFMRLDRKIPGMYAMSCSAKLPAEKQAQLDGTA
ncbi:Transcription elongation factor SPT4 [Ceraceosorus bombacis]|uniref:Transcription elongation factor SPT4 n=1 Tax=Ceraceosorus bombacis TaxID=401625 RepID=A0A0P1BF81_9BASI|nr:Transcription elongation factor SPT4 [Ceraceosorus bombacis]